MTFNLKIFFTKIKDRYESLKVWDRRSRNYHLMFPPNSPSKEDIEIYREQFIGIKTSCPVLVLGVTPQLRSALSDIFERVILAEFSRKMYFSTLKRMKQEVLEKENFLWTDWLNLTKALSFSAVDLVVGDLVFMQLSPGDREAFLDNIFKILKPGGFFISRIKMYNSFWRDVNPYDITHDLYEKGEPLSRFLLYRFGDKVLNTENFSFRVNDIMPLFAEAVRDSQDAKEKESVISAMNYYKETDGNITRSYFPKTYFDSWISQRFDIAKVSYSSDYEESEFYQI